ncbi:class A beta-lactamase [Pseudorhodoferax sp. Leaf274]|uniref:class A beta-lactamase n=1 Tax=Pseudorhodoferax sp. Leaf274 TaxID=1736318 RepID=UPI00070265AA|nr:class A beta-lactamase [Pseudorhodoferax sp. Leaf274]KQP47706.1 class A beta-lactamase [Pseudorhodoferax sp. Leaf274]
MHPSISRSRRALLLAAAATPLLGACAAAPRRAGQAQAELALAALEQGFAGRIGVCALDTADGALLGQRADERFPMCSSFKAMLAAAILARSSTEPDLLAQQVRYGRGDLLAHSPVTTLHLDRGMSVAALCEATVQTSDNAAANLLLQRIGGPAGLTAFMRSIGDDQFRLDRWELALNSSLPGDPRDTTTPRAMATSLRRLAVGDALAPAQRAQLAAWLRGTTTGAERIRAGMPAGWAVGNKTGTSGQGSYGSAIDVAVVWPPARAPLVLAVFTTRHAADAPALDAPIAQATRIVAQWAA